MGSQMKLFNLLFPKKCLLCSEILEDTNADLCPACRKSVPWFQGKKKDVQYVKECAGVWLYENQVRQSILAFKFHGRRHYARRYAPYLAQAVSQQITGQADLITYVPVSFRRKLRRGYDQVALLAKALSKVTGIPAVRTLRKHRHTPPQSTMGDISRRRANVLGAYRAYKPENFSGKRLLLLDDIITTGATTSECAKTLLLSGAGEVYCAALALRRDQK